MDLKYNAKKIHDPVHGTMGFSEIEVELINTKAFQRLRNIKQLGLANYVFPGADYTRFSHSLGVCHLCGKLYDAKSKLGTIDEQEKQKIRLAGLLHDIGHYPFSHAFEQAIENYYILMVNKKDDQIVEVGSKYDVEKDAEDVEKSEPSKDISIGRIDHESVGRIVLENDAEIIDILQRNGILASDIYNLFKRNIETDKNAIIANIISSDLDADRLDYLLRSSYHVGLPYGSNDLDYILSQIRTDNHKNICIDPKALRTVDHFLLCRYFDYAQTVFHKSVAGFEEVLKQLIICYLIEGNLEGDSQIFYLEKDIIESIKDGSWYAYDDIYIMQLIRNRYKGEKSEDVKLLAKSILHRIPPKEIIKIEYIKDDDSFVKEQFESEIKQLETLKNDISINFGIAKNNIFVWNNHGFKITKVGRNSEIMDIGCTTGTTGEYNNIDQIVRIYDRTTGESKPILNRDDSLMWLLSNYKLYSSRLYVLFDKNKNAANTEASIQLQIRKDIEKKYTYLKFKFK
jgi:HD superfamily phosphohydrolase